MKLNYTTYINNYKNNNYEKRLKKKTRSKDSVVLSGRAIFCHWTKVNFKERLLVNSLDKI